MWHRFSVELAVIAMVSILGGGFVASSMQSVATPSSSTGSEASEVTHDTAARIYERRNNRGTGRRGVVG